MQHEVNTIAPFARPMYLMAKAIGWRCNLACQYCYYLEKSYLYTQRGHSVMSDETLETFIRSYIEAQTSPDVLFTWHGGEPTLRPLAFYRRAMELQQKYAGGRTIENCIQTNGTLLNDEWCHFLRENNWLVGISIDGTADMHNAYRHTANGKDTHHLVLKGIRLLNKHKVEWNAMAVVNALNANHPKEFYNYFKEELECQYLQFSPVVERLLPNKHLANVQEDAPLAPFSITPKQWGSFLCGVFDEWVRQDVGKVFVQIFDATLANWVGAEPGLCTMARTCGHAAVVEHNGDLYSCDHYVFAPYKLGNIHTKSIAEMMYSAKQQKFGQDKFDTLTQQCRRCSYLFACHGECPRNRFATSSDGESGHNYLCHGYFRFFHHVAPYMDFMKRELLAGRPPANVMGMRF